MDATFRTSPQLERLGLEFLADFLERARLRQPGNSQVLAELGATYTKLGRYSDGLAADREVVRLTPDNETAHYNLACSLALCGEVREALVALEEAVRLGYDDPEHLAEDEDLRSLRDEPQFAALVERLRKSKG